VINAVVVFGQLINYWIAPVMVCKKPVGTVGLGDAISSMGLMYSKYKWFDQNDKGKGYSKMF
jgi:hypothetical protein